MNVLVNLTVVQLVLISLIPAVFVFLAMIRKINIAKQKIKEAELEARQYGEEILKLEKEMAKGIDTKDNELNVVTLSPRYKSATN
jgi:hypothetical protein